MSRLPGSAVVATRIVRVTIWVWLAIPVALAVIMSVVSPTYFRPMFTSIVGWVLIFVAASVIGGGFIMTRLATRWMARGRAYTAVGIAIILIVFLVQFVTYWIVLLGPAVLIVLSSPAS